MRGLMQDAPLTVSTLLPRMEGAFAAKQITTHAARGPAATATFGDVAHRARLLGSALETLGVPRYARIGTFGWNSQRHLELFLGVPASSRVLHTINHRLHHQQVRYIVDHAEDDVLFVDRSLLHVVWPTVTDAPSVRHIVVMADGTDVPLPDDRRILDHDELLAAQSAPHHLRVRDERAAATLCYTSGTTGRPKGVLYDHRSIVLHALLLLAADSFAISETDVVLPIVPMFHVNAWGLPYAAAMAGAALSLPGPAMDPTSLAEQLVTDAVTFAGAVPTVWRSLVPHLPERDLSHLRKAVCGGGAMPDDLREAYHALGVTLTGAWGMTETSPLVTHARVPSHRSLDPDAAREVLSLPGQAVPLVDLRLRQDDGTLAPDDGSTPGELQVRGPTIAASYFRSDAKAVTEDGWLRTGDVATIATDGTMQIVDRAKDLIKSGGEWISSVELENAIMAHPGITEAAVTAQPDERWSERPHAWVVPTAPGQPTAQELLDFLRPRVAKWWLPDYVTFVTQLPRTATGKVSKVALRESQAEDI